MGFSRRTKATVHFVKDLHGNVIQRAGRGFDKLEVPDEFFTADGAVLKPKMEVWFPYGGQWHCGNHRGFVSENKVHNLWVIDVGFAHPPLRHVYFKRPEHLQAPPDLQTSPLNKE